MSQSPGLPARATLGRRSGIEIQPHRGCVGNAGWLAAAGEHNPVGVGWRVGRGPGVARAAQPRAVGCNPGGVDGTKNLLAKRTGSRTLRA